jgi:hypothetical protein
MPMNNLRLRYTHKKRIDVCSIYNAIKYADSILLENKAPKTVASTATTNLFVQNISHVLKLNATGSFPRACITGISAPAIQFENPNSSDPAQYLFTGITDLRHSLPVPH